MNVTPMKTYRYKLCTEIEGLCYCRTQAEAEQFALDYADTHMVAVRIFDRFAHVHDVNLWEVRPAEVWLRPIGIKQARAA